MLRAWWVIEQAHGNHPGQSLSSTDRLTLAGNVCLTLVAKCKFLIVKAYEKTCLKMHFQQAFQKQQPSWSQVG